ncbi:MAG: anti-sigma factor antagonist [Solobacterium sp.]|nr:anti-sigma factor antagonist [Solobacterium sp.]MBR0214742.1 anti-sigma factor antagonist [Solobacterium sp.]
MTQMDNTVMIRLSGRIDSANSAEIENDILKQLEGKTDTAVTLDVEELEYISSAGLRVILRVKKTWPDVRIINASPEVYEILETTGFTEMMTVEKAYKVISVEGCEVIGEGFNGKVYRVDKDNVVKVYKNADALADIQHEREVARLALILGVPTAISYDVVKVGDSYGSVFELLNARSFAKILADEPERMDWCVTEYINLLKKVHGITVPEGKLPSSKEKIVKWENEIRADLPEAESRKLEQLIAGMPDSDHMIHGDYHTKNIVLAGDEVLLIDMDTLCAGYPIYELAQMYNSYIGFSEYNPEIVRDFQGFSPETARTFWHKCLQAYFETEDEEKLKKLEDKIRCVSYTRLISWKYRHPSNNSEEDKVTAELWKSHLSELLERVDSLSFEDGDTDAQGG